jgi:hypothetical protein
VSARIAGPIRKLGSDIRANPRLQAGLAVVAAILVLYGVLVLLELRQAREQAYIQRVEQLRKMRALAGQDAWIGRAQAAARVRQALAAEIPELETVGVAQAQLTSWVREIAQAFGGNAVQIQSQTAQQVAGEAGLWRVPVTLSGEAPPARVVDLIQQVERRSVLTVIEQAMVQNRENKTYSLTLVAYVRIRGGTTDGAP